MFLSPQEEMVRPQIGMPVRLIDFAHREALYGGVCRKFLEEVCVDLCPLTQVSCSQLIEIGIRREVYDNVFRWLSRRPRSVVQEYDVAAVQTVEFEVMCDKAGDTVMHALYRGSSPDSA